MLLLKSKKPVFSATIGSVLEWYDFLLYAYFAPLLAPLFFPGENQFVSLILAYSALAIGFLVRPLGAIVIGRMGDTQGRRKALIFTIVVMTASTVALGLLPTYATVGVWAPILLVLMRCLQGFAVSGEINSAASFLVEHDRKNRRGFSGSLVMASGFLGILLGALVVTLCSSLLSTETLQSGGWRIPFLLSFVFGIIGFFIRLRAIESPYFQSLLIEKQEVKAPLKNLFTQHFSLTTKAVLIASIVATSNYIFLSYFNVYLEKSAGFTLGKATLINSVGIILFIISILFSGFLSDKIGRKRLFIIGSSLLFIVTLPVFSLLSLHTVQYALLAELLFALVLGIPNGIILTLLAELFTTNIRNSGAAISYNVSQAIFGGTSPLIALSLVHWLQRDNAPAIYIMLCALLSLAVVVTIKETHNQPLKS